MQTNEGNQKKPARHSSLGFGLERLGVVAVEYPRIASLLLLISLVFSALVIPGLRFDGNVVNVVNQNSQAYKDFKFQNEFYRNFAGDTWLIVKNPRLATAKGLEELRSLHLDLTLEDDVAGVFSIFSLGDISKGVDNFKPLVPDVVENDAQAKSILATILKEQPAAAAILSPDKDAVMMVVSLDVKNKLSENRLSDILSNLKSAAVEASPPDVEILMSGYPAIRMSIVDVIMNDQTLLTLAGIVIGALVSLVVFGNLTSAIICTIPPAIAVSWILALFSLSGVELNFLTTVLPSLALVIAFADGIVIFFRWQTLNKENHDMVFNLKDALWRVGPASSLTSITTALAFVSFAWTGSETMRNFALFGAAAVMLAFVAVIIALPLVSYWASRLGLIKSGARGPAFKQFGGYIAAHVLKNPPMVISVSLVFLALLGWVHLQLQPSYDTDSHLPKHSEIRAAEKFSDEAFIGTAQILIIVPVSKGGTFWDEENRRRIHEVTAIAESQFGKKRTLSLDQVWARIDDSEIENIAKQILSTEGTVQGRFLASDEKSMMVVAQESSGTNTSMITASVEKLKASMARLPYAGEIRITGLPVLLASEFPPLINQLRTGLLLAIFLAVGVVGLATRSFSLALATLVPNLLPLLFAEAVIWVSGTNLDITKLIALTIAFGIAIDNAVHVINSYCRRIARGQMPEEALKSALADISPALLASTVIVCVGFVITQFSAMPSINMLGRLLVLTLSMALATNLLVLPSYVLFLGRLGRSDKLQQSKVS